MLLSFQSVILRTRVGLTIFFQRLSNVLGYAHVIVFRSSLIFCVVPEGFPDADGTECFVVLAFYSFLVCLVELPFEICELAFKVEEVSCAEFVEFAEDEGFVVGVDS